MRILASLAARALLTAALALAAGAQAAPAARAPQRQRRSPSPAAATRPALHPRASERARASSLHASRRTNAKKRKTKGPPPLPLDAQHALAAFEAMQRQYYISGSGLYDDDGEPFSYLWPFSQAFAATVTLANIPHLSSTQSKRLREQLEERLSGLNDYLDPDNSGAPEGTYTSTLPAFDGTVAPPAGPGGTKYYDDNDWVALELVRLYQMTHKTAFLGSAEGIMAFEMAAWQQSPELGCAGGIPFSNAAENNERNAVTTAPAAELGALLYRYTHQASDLQFAEKAYEWVRGCLLEPNGLYGDHVNRAGTLQPAQWSYNQGSMIGAGTLLYQASGNAGYLSQARQTAKAALASFTPERLARENPFFVAVYFRNLLYLDSVTHEPPGPSVAQAYVNYEWEHERLSGDVFVSSLPAAAGLLDQAAITQIYGLLSSPPSSYF